MGRKRKRKATRTPRQPANPTHEEEAFTFDLGELRHGITRARSWAGEHKRALTLAGLVLLMLIPLFLSLHFRLYPTDLPVTERWAADSLTSSLRAQIQQGLAQQGYANLPADRRQAVIDEELQRILDEQGANIDAQAEQLADQFRSRLQDESGQTYFLAIDPYHYLRRAELIVETGSVCDEVRNGVCYDDHKVAPLGVPTERDFHSSLGAWAYSLVSIVNPNTTVKNVFFYIPALIAALSVIPAFFLGRKVGGPLGGFTAAMLVALNASFLGRTPAGFVDTDAYNVFFPLLILWLLVEALEARHLWARIALTAGSAVATALFSWAWKGWWYAFDFAVVILVGVVGFHILHNLILSRGRLDAVLEYVRSQRFRDRLVVLAGFIIITLPIVALLGTDPGYPIRGPLDFLIIKQASQASLWPNVLTTVAELNEASFSQIVGSFGHRIFFFLAIMGIAFSIIPERLNWRYLSYLLVSVILAAILVSSWALGLPQNGYLALLLLPAIGGLLLLLFDRREEINVLYAIFITVWFFGTIFASLRGVRFVFLMVPAFAVAVGIAVGRLSVIMRRWLADDFDLKPWIVTGIIWVAVILLLIQPVQTAHRTALGEVPSMSDAWVTSLTKIRDESQPDAIVNSWWDFGHWFKYWADRAVTFDGGSQNTPMAHWIGRALITEEEDVSVGILRMLDCGSNKAFESLNNHTNDTVRSIDLLYEIIPLYDEAQARQRLLAEGIPPDVAQRTLGYTHCDPPENYFITSQDMVGKAGVWGHFGTWDFRRSYIYNELRDEPQAQAVRVMRERLGYEEDEARELYQAVQGLASESAANQWISPWPGYVTSSWRGCSNTTRNGSTIVRCALGIQGGRASDGSIATIEALEVDLAAPENATLLIGLQDPATGMSRGSAPGKARQIVIADTDTYEVFDYEGGTSFTGLLDVAEGNYRLLVMDPLHKMSTFTKLFFLGGRYTEHFELFSDERSYNGWRILVWKVDWDGEEASPSAGSSSTVNIISTE